MTASHALTQVNAGFHLAQPAAEPGEPGPSPGKSHVNPGFHPVPASRSMRLLVLVVPVLQSGSRLPERRPRADGATPDPNQIETNLFIIRTKTAQCAGW
jgi:hypothetical protein